MPRRCTRGLLRSCTVVSALRITRGGCTAPRCWMVCASSCASSCRPARCSGWKRPRPKKTSRPTVKAAALRRRLARAALSSACTRTGREVGAEARFHVAPHRRGQRHPGGVADAERCRQAGRGRRQHRGKAPRLRRARTGWQRHHAAGHPLGLALGWLRRLRDAHGGGGLRRANRRRRPADRNRRSRLGCAQHHAGGLCRCAHERSSSGKQPTAPALAKKRLTERGG